MTSPAVAHIWQKLDRANAHIRELEWASDEFQKGAGRSLRNPDLAAQAEFYERLKDPPPANFSIIAGEAIHQLRSSLDHLVAALIRFERKNASTKKSSFPIFKERPVDQKDVDRYNKSIKGIRRREVITFIERNQPYHRGDKAEGHWLAVLTEKWNLDKHRALDVFRVMGQVTEDQDDGEWSTSSSRPDDGSGRSLNCDVEEAQVDRTLTVYIAFEEWHPNAPKGTLGVVGVLRELEGAVRTLVSEAEVFLR